MISFFIIFSREAIALDKEKTHQMYLLMHSLEIYVARRKWMKAFGRCTGSGDDDTWVRHERQMNWDKINSRVEREDSWTCRQGGFLYCCVCEWKLRKGGKLSANFWSWCWRKKSMQGKIYWTFWLEWTCANKIFIFIKSLLELWKILNSPAESTSLVARRTCTCRSISFGRDGFWNMAQRCLGWNDNVDRA